MEESNSSSDNDEDSDSDYSYDNKEHNLILKKTNASAVSTTPTTDKTTFTASMLKENRKRRIISSDDEEEEIQFNEAPSTRAIAEQTAIIHTRSLPSITSTSKTQPKIKNKNAVAYLDLEAEDKHKCSDEECEMLDEVESEDEMFVVKSDESSVEEGEIFTRGEHTALQPHLWDNMQNIVLRGSPNAPPATGYSKTVSFFCTLDDTTWIFRMFEDKFYNTIVHAFVSFSSSDHFPNKLPKCDTTELERLDFNIILSSSIEKLEEISSLTINSFVVYNKACANAFVRMIFLYYPINTILFPFSHRGIESAIKKSIFSNVDGNYLIKRT